MDYLKPYADEFITDTYGSAVAVINPEHEYKVVIEGHSDEISWYVNYISEKGLIDFPLGRTLYINWGDGEENTNESIRNLLS